jgi:hypothetical protein
MSVRALDGGAAEAIADVMGVKRVLPGVAAYLLPGKQ